MRVDFGNLQLKSDDDLRALRLARAARAVVGSVVVAALVVGVAVSTSSWDTPKPLVGASAGEFQLFLVPDANDAAFTSPREPSSSEVDEALKSLIGVTHHG